MCLAAEAEKDLPEVVVEEQLRKNFTLVEKVSPKELGTTVAVVVEVDLVDQRALGVVGKDQEYQETEKST